MENILGNIVVIFLISCEFWLYEAAYKNIIISFCLYSRSNRIITCKTDKHKILTFLFSLLIQMPEPNVLFLRHLLSVLHRIKGCSSINHMDAYALSVLIAPNMLWNPTPSSSAFGNDLSKKASGPLLFCLWEKSWLWSRNWGYLWQIITVFFH